MKREILVLLCKLNSGKASLRCEATIPLKRATAVPKVRRPVGIHPIGEAQENEGTLGDDLAGNADIGADQRLVVPILLQAAHIAPVAENSATPCRNGTHKKKTRLKTTGSQKIVEQKWSYCSNFLVGKFPRSVTPGYISHGLTSVSGDV